MAHDLFIGFAAEETFEGLSKRNFRIVHYYVNEYGSYVSQIIEDHFSVSHKNKNVLQYALKKSIKIVESKGLDQLYPEDFKNFIVVPLTIEERKKAKRIFN